MGAFFIGKYMENIYTQELLNTLGELLDSMDYEDDPIAEYNDQKLSYTLVKESEWEDQGRRAYKTMVFEFTDLVPDNSIFVQADLERTGDYYQGYEYEETAFSFVTQKTKTVVKKFYTKVTL